MEAFFRPLLEGRKGGVASLALRVALSPLGIAYGLAMKVREGMYSCGIAKSFSASTPVISVGNITAGGTGKTPFVIRLCEILCELGARPGILLRGYGASDPQDADEVRLYRARFGEKVKVFPGSDRVACARKAVEEGVNVLVMDDGFQHLRLKRDLDIVLLDASCPFGGGLPVPAGLLREFKGALRRADMLCLTRCENDDEKQRACALLAGMGLEEPLVSRHVPAKLRFADDSFEDSAALKGKKVVAVCGIGRPDSFFATLNELGADTTCSKVFSDHYDYTQADADMLFDIAEKEDAILLMTEKDAVKFFPLCAGEARARVAALGVELAILDEASLLARLQDLVVE